MLKTMKGLFSEEHLTCPLHSTQAAGGQKSEKSSQKYKVRWGKKKKTLRKKKEKAPSGVSCRTSAGPKYCSPSAQVSGL